jgi:magnesium transporter
MVAVLEREFFLSEILGRRVFMRTERVGRLGDLVIVEAGPVPEVSHLVVERSFGYPSLLVPWHKVSLISNTEIVVDDHDVAPYERTPGPGSILLKDHILDKKILDLDDHEVEVVYDVKLVLQHDRLYASEVDFSRNRLLRRMGLKKLANWLGSQNPDGNTVSWKYVQPLPEHIGAFSGHVKLNVLKENIGDIHPVDLADILEELDSSQRLAIFNQLEPEQASDTLEEVEPRVQRELIDAMDKRQVAPLIDRMSPSQAADVLAALPADQADELLGLIDKDTADRVQQIIDRHDENVLLFATQLFIRLPATTPVKDVMTNFRQIALDMEVIMYVYVTDAEGRLQGVVDLRELIAAEPDQTLGEIMTDNLITLGPKDTLGDATAALDRYGFRALPVVDDTQRLLGVVSHRDIRGIKPRL